MSDSTQIAQINPADIISQELTTTSVKIAEAFGKLHKNIIQKIDDIKSQVPDDWHKLNFQPMQIDVEIGNGATRKDRAFEITKDGFVLLVMGFTGAKAMQIKIAYINAFNWMAQQLTSHQPKAALPEPPTITKAQQGELATLVANKSTSSGKPRAYYWSRFQNHFKIASYKDVPSDKFDEAADYMRRLEGDNNPLLTLSQSELEALIAERVQSVSGELMQKQSQPVVAAPYNGRVTMMFQDGNMVGAYEEKEGTFNTHPDTIASQIREILAFQAPQLRQIAEVCLERLSSLAR